MTRMACKAYRDNIYGKTGKTAEDYRKIAKEKELTEHAELPKWLKADCGLGHGHANAVILHVNDPALAKKVAEGAENEK